MKRKTSNLKFIPGDKILIVLLTISMIFLPHCSGNRIERITGFEVKAVQLSKEIPFIKLHMKNGDVYIFDNWKMDQKENVVLGNGNHLDMNRQLIDQGEFKLSIKDVALAETNVIKNSAAVTALTFATVITGIFTVVCITNPKACFGSCPTFYANNGNEYIVQSEGFSSSISPCLEEKDIDALFRIKPESENFEIQLRNEAYETHVIRKANVLALPKKKGNRVFAAMDDKFYEAGNLIGASEVVGEEGDCSEKLCSFDGVERFSPADSNNLAEKEIIEISFNNITEGNKGLVIASRQTLLTTFLFYQGLAYMGSSAGYFLANLERNSEEVKKIIDQPRKELGNIEVFVETVSGDWKKAGEIGEHGPISTDIKIVPLNNLNTSSSIKIKLRMTKGLWRIDYLALADLKGKVDPVIISPSDAFPKLTGYNSNVTELLTNEDSVLVTFPGDKYFLQYKLPEDFENYELFLESQGYYLEWMREEWLAEENPAKVYQMFFNPQQFFKDLAPQFKKVEAEMEETFWSSKYVYP
ncbi:MAG: hypothetical protein Q7S39_08445 [Ignavibacteria bacterium]|nr:hypothetical protein [Ignavibacteria bacterium]